MRTRTHIIMHVSNLCILFVAFLFAACCEEQLVYLKKTELPADKTIHLTASRMQVVTRSGDTDIHFDAGTFYRLFAAETPDSGATYVWDEGLLIHSLGVETDVHEIRYGLASTEDTQGSTVSYTTGTKLDFYGITFGTNVDPLGDSSPVSAIGDEATCYKVSYDATADSIPDILYSTNLKKITEENAGGAMKFTHSLSSVKFKISRQEQESSKITNGTAKDLSKVTLEKIEVIEPKREGTFDIVSGTWSYEESTDTLIRPFYERKEGDEAIAIPVETNGSYAEVPGTMSIFPNTGQKAVKVRITLSVDGTEVVEDYAINSGTYDRDKDVMTYSPFQFESNYQYTLSILLLESGMRVIAIIPAKYEWIDYDVASVDAYLGQPVTFNGLMWMDRNLGAKTADCENDFYGSIGYYYQHGRNIPYILDSEKLETFYFKEDGSDKETKEFPADNNFFIMTNDEQNREAGLYLESANLEFVDKYSALYWRAGKPTTYKKSVDALNKFSESEKKALEEAQLQCVYTYDHEGKPVYGIRQPSIAESLEEKEIIRFPGDSLTGDDYGKTHDYYKFTCVRNLDPIDKKNKGNLSLVWTCYDGYESANIYNNGKGLWNDINDQPCPKGWRLPTHADAVNFMPQDPSMKEDYYKLRWQNTKWSNASFTETSLEQTIYGKVTKEDNTVYYVLYMLKNPYTEQAYRIRIQTHFCKYTENGCTKESQNKRYISVSRFTADATHGLSYYVNKDNNDVDNQESKLWKDPVETIYFPCAGFIVTEYRAETILKGNPPNITISYTTNENDPVFPDLRSFGTGSVIRTSEDAASTGNRKSNAIYLSTTNFGVSNTNDTRRSLGEQVRCVRDISAKGNE